MTESLHSSRPLWEARDVQHAREQAEEAMFRYAMACWYWNAPDEEHTRLQIRALAERVLDETFEELKRV